MNKEKVIYAIGHRNPDTDSICSAISYSYLKNALGVKNVVPARAGELNKETEFILNYFGFEKPQLVKDIYPRVRNITNVLPAKVTAEDSLYTLGQVMKEAKVRSVPVVDAEDKLIGMASVSDLAKAYLKEIDGTAKEEMRYPIADAVKILNGTVLSEGDMDKVVTKGIIIADSCMERCASSLKEDEIVVIGNRSDRGYSKCINAKVACVIVTDGAEVSEEVVAEAKAANVTIIATKYNAMEVVHLLGQCLPVSSIMTKKVITFSPDDLLSDIKGIMKENEYRNYPVVDVNNKLIGVINKDDFVMPDRQEIILTDHNELVQAVEGIESGKIIEVIDHHRFGGLQTSDPIFINVRPVGCTCTIVTNMYQQHGVTPPKEIAGLLMSAIISDTVLFKSPTCTETDKAAVEYLSKIAGVDYNEYGLEMLKAGADVGDMTPAQIVKNDSKEFTIGEHPMLISQLSVLDTEPILAKKDEIVAEMKKLCEEKGYDMDIVILTDIIKEGSYLIFVGEPKNLIGEAFGEDASKGIMYLDGVMSRKKQVVPPLSEAVKRI